MILTTEEKIHYNEQKICYICKKEFDKNHKKHYKVRDHCHYTGKYRGAAHNICNLRYKIPKEIPAVFHNGSTYNYHFIIKELVQEFDGNFECLGKNTESLLIVIDLCQCLYQNSSIIYLKEFIIINVLIVNLVSIT